MYRAEGVLFSNIDAFGGRTIREWAMVNVIWRISPPKWPILIKVQEGEEYEGSSKGNACIQSCRKYVVVTLPPGLFELEDTVVENEAC